MKKFLLVLLAGVALAACQEEVSIEKPLPVTMSVEAVGHYCQMTVLEHDGPKAQIHLAGNPFPIWFTQVRDAVAFTVSPEEAKDYTAVYVNDMAKAESWEQPGVANWIDAQTAWFVIESHKKGGMGAPETIPFGEKQAAESFAEIHGGRIVRLDEIPADYVLGSFMPTALNETTHHSSGSETH